MHRSVSYTHLDVYKRQVQDKLILPEPAPNSDPSWFGFLLTVREGVDREKVVRYIEEKGVQTRMLFSGNLIKHPCFDEMRKSGEGYRVVGTLDNTDRIMRCLLYTSSSISGYGRILHQQFTGSASCNLFGK